MASRTSTETKREITRRGDVVVVKETEKTTTYAPGKEPVTKEVTRVREYNGMEDFKRLPEDVRRQLQMTDGKATAAAGGKVATRGNFAEDCLAEHNKYRKIHGANPLKLNQELMRVSYKRAQDLASRDEMTSKSDHCYGENVSCLWSSDPEHFVRASDIVSRWYAEGSTYNYDEEPRNMEAGHFTQIIWASSTDFGIAAVKSRSNKIYVVASYSPSGNYLGRFKENVRRPGFIAKTSENFFKTNLDFSVSDALANEKSVPSLEIVMSELNKEGVNCHNAYRKKHGVSPLRLNKELARYAQEWAEELARRDKMEHRTERRYGENLYCFKSTNPADVASAAQACKSWYDEIQYYDFNSEPRSLASGHFTQMIWRGTREIGMGFAKSKTGLQIIVANYNPPGNYIGTFKANVPEPLS